MRVWALLFVVLAAWASNVDACCLCGRRFSSASFGRGGEGPTPLSCFPPGSGVVVEPRGKDSIASSTANFRFLNSTYSEYGVNIYLRRADGVYRLLDTVIIRAGVTEATGNLLRVGDDVLFDTWTRGTPQSAWSFVRVTQAKILGPDGECRLQTGDILYPLRK